MNASVRVELIQVNVSGAPYGRSEKAMPRALQMIIEQQRAMSSALLAVRTLARKALRSGSSPDFSQLTPLVRYVERFPETLHQPNEERHLFRVVEVREPGLARLIARFRRDHSAMKGYGSRLRTALGYWQQGDPKAGRQTAIVADDYVRFCRQHARAERTDLLPAALKVLSDAEWLQIDQVLASVVDPLARSKNRQDCEMALHRLFP
jgi:hemerythrin-like domain-containing protein